MIDQGFVYLDNEDRLVAVTDTPYIQKGEFALLRCNAVNEFGALKLNGTYTKSGSGSVTYGRYIIGVNYGDYWDLIGPPVSGVDAADFIGANGDLAENHITCLSCSKGKYSSTYAGNSINVCIDCPLGKYNNEIASNSSKKCIICPAGKFSEILGSKTTNDCKECPKGKYLPIGGGESLNDCLNTPIGEFSLKGSGSSTKCPQGKYSNNINSWECLNCPLGKFSNEEGTINCKICPPNSEQTPERNNWYCTQGSYEVLTNSSRECITCPKNTVCPVNTLIETIQLEAGYWRSNPESLNIIPCRKKEYCIGGYDNISHLNCKEGHYGPLCDTCIQGWAKISGGICVKCPEEDKGLNYFISVIEKLKWLKPVRPEDTITLHREIKSKRLSKTNKNIGIVIMLFEAKNQKDELVLSMEVCQMIKPRNAKQMSR